MSYLWPTCRFISCGCSHYFSLNYDCCHGAIRGPFLGWQRGQYFGDVWCSPWGGWVVGSVPVVKSREEGERRWRRPLVVGSVISIAHHRWLDLHKTKRRCQLFKANKLFQLIDECAPPFHLFILFHFICISFYLFIISFFLLIDQFW